MVETVCVADKFETCIVTNITVIQSSSNQEPSKATGLFICVSFWFLSLVSNELRQYLLAKKNNDVLESFFTTTISGNMVDLMSYVLFLIAFIFHLVSFNVDGDDYPQGPLVITPQLDENDFILYCPFYLPKYLVIAQACFHNLRFS